MIDERVAQNPLRGPPGPATDELAAYGLLRDHRGDVALLLDPAGRIAERYDYDAWGRWVVRTPGDDGVWGTPDDTYARDGHHPGDDGLAFTADDTYHAPSGNLLGFTGRWWMPHANAWQIRARWYRADLKRWLSPDPLGFVDGMNRYAYAGHNPLRFVDPSGLKFTSTDSGGFGPLAFASHIGEITGNADAARTARAVDHFNLQGDPFQLAANARFFRHQKRLATPKTSDLLPWRDPARVVAFHGTRAAGYDVFESAEIGQVASDVDTAVAAASLAGAVRKAPGFFRLARGADDAGDFARGARHAFGHTGAVIRIGGDAVGTGARANRAGGAVRSGSRAAGGAGGGGAPIISLTSGQARANASDFVATISGRNFQRNFALPDPAAYQRQAQRFFQRPRTGLVAMAQPKVATAPTRAKIGQRIDTRVETRITDPSRMLSSPQFIGADEFAALPRTGVIDPSRIRFSQDSIGASFKPPFGSISDFAAGLRTGSIDPGSVKPIRLVERNGQVFTLDNRRLQSFRQAGIGVPFQRLDQIPKRELFKFTSQNEGVEIAMRPGRQ